MSGIRPGENDVLLVIDVQNDFCPGGALEVPRGDEVVPIVNRLARRFSNVVLTQDWHPPDHLSFASAHLVLWPDHCVQGSLGADFHTVLSIPHAGLVLRKGTRRTIDSYSAFYENDRRTPTGLVGYLRERNIAQVFVAGLAFDFCVRYSAEDAARAGFNAIVIDDACRGIDMEGSMAATHRSFESLHIPCVSEQVFS